ncbi:cobalamin-binding protein [Pedobacter yulinensis]|uniref:Cobalamin-binding protein n=1 Tax=Pedobacter yulinensis TaxID=2126353 RepID=A0A2T3HN68_9SPHI|nr:helical backbone metal receptor [Pedobacter yulinensis]PST83857.1 cobalamin-binding protein [Pedobacter yulinensis]
MATRTYTDQLGRTVTVPFRPQKIVSVVPSLTELLFDLGLDKEVAGVTKFCIHPIGKFAGRPKVGGTKKLKLDIIEAIGPDLIIASKEENTRADIEALSARFPVWVSDIVTIEDSLQALTEIGAMVDREPEAAYLKHLITAGFNDLGSLALNRQIAHKTMYLIWRNPWMAAGQSTYIDSIMRQNGLQNVVQEERYPALAEADLKKLDPGLVLLSSEPFPFRSEHAAELQAILPNARILLVDGEMFSWYGSRMVKAVQYFFEWQKLVQGT